MSHLPEQKQSDSILSMQHVTKSDATYGEKATKLDTLEISP